jgi:formiminoglutamate deiminase
MAQTKSLYFHSALLPEGWASGVRLEIAGGTFLRIETGVSPHPGEVCGALAVPGLPNLHSHAFQRGMAGLTEQRTAQHDSFWSWRELLYRFVARMTPDDVEAISAQAYVEMLEAGFTRVGEFHYLHHSASGAPYADPAEMSARIVAAAAHTGIGLTLLPVFYAHSGFGGTPPVEQQRRFVCDLEGYARLVERARELASTLPHARVGVAPHSLRAVTLQELRVVCGLAADGPVHVHVAEQLREVQECEAWCGKRPVECLLDAQPIDARFCLVHATHLSERELARVSRSGAVVGLCPITEANLGDGVFPTRAWLDAGGEFGIGSDSNVQIGANDELRLLEYVQRLTSGARSVLAEHAQPHTGRALFERAVRGGARALAVPAGITVGAPADLVSLALERPLFAGRSRDLALDTWIFAAGPGCVDRVLCCGVEVVTDGRHRERARIGARFRATLEGLLREA